MEKRSIETKAYVLVAFVAIVLFCIWCFDKLNERMAAVEQRTQHTEEVVMQLLCIWGDGKECEMEKP